MGIPVDYIAGTSMGGIMAALYAVGYDGRQMESIVKGTNWEDLFTDTPPRHLMPYFQKKDMGKYQLEFGLEGYRPFSPAGLIQGQKISLLFSSFTFPYEGFDSFDELPIPYRCIAVDLITGNQVILKDGSLAVAMRSTMSIPTVFSPVPYGDSLLVDGGILNNMPVDVVREMGADIVIAVDVAGQMKKREEIKTVLDVMEQSLNLLGIDQWKKNKKMADIFIQPDLIDYSLLDFTPSKIKQIINRGNEAADKMRSSLDSLKQQYNLQRHANPGFDLFRDRTMFIRNVMVAGQTTVPFETITDWFGIVAGDIYDPVRCAERISEIKSKDIFENVSYEVIPASPTTVRLVLHVEEKSNPIIYGIDIEGNEKLSFSFIYQMLKLKPGDELDIDVLNQYVMEMYGLGHFENILYEVIPLEENHVRLKLIVRESTMRKLRVGFYYDNFNKMIGRIGIYGSSIFSSRFRFESDLQFSGRSQIEARVIYQTRMFDRSIYPFVHFRFKDNPVPIYDFDGIRIAQYQDRTFLGGLGVGFLIGKSGCLEFENYGEKIDVQPSIALPDPIAFPSWDHTLNILHMKGCVDELDNVLLPRKGYRLEVEAETSLKQLGSPLYYWLTSLSFDYYHSPNQFATLRGFLYSGLTSDDAPTYKIFNLGHPQEFVGMGFEQLAGNRITMLRGEYRYQLSDYVYLKVMANIILDYSYYYPTGKVNASGIRGEGVSLVVMTPLGPFEITYAEGSKGTHEADVIESHTYLTFGFSYR